MPRAGDLPKETHLDERYFVDHIYVPYKEYINYLARKKCDHPDDIDDVVQSTWELLIKNSDKFLSVPKNKQASYIATIITNVIRMNKRKKTLDTCSLESIPDPGYDPGHLLDLLLDRGHMVNQFQKAWSKVTPSVREILERYYILEQSHREIAEDMGISPNNVRTYIYRARKSAKKELLTLNRSLMQQWNDTEI